MCHLLTVYKGILASLRKDPPKPNHGPHSELTLLPALYYCAKTVKLNS